MDLYTPTFPLVYIKLTNLTQYHYLTIAFYSLVQSPVQRTLIFTPPINHLTSLHSHKMFFRTVATLFSLAVLLGSSLVQAVPSLHQRQIGNLECNVDRIQIVSDLFSASSTARKLTTEHH
ncbi:hypothetical protein NLI96_g3059 [Meripilus lineatus]|uniref:Uncharacterized protein n=1 Tax=Meripilus lineatus TaxID=2056292 RepID=A0AAD5V7N3_9APHY|nr:hypothetical protein NLI96_g3059 [Physisporinus lineatus]